MREWSHTHAFVLTARAEGDADELAARLRQRGRKLADALGAPETVVRVSARIPAVADDPEWDVYSQILDGGLSNGVRLGGFDAVLRVEVHESVVERFLDVLAREAVVLDPLARSTMSVVVGREVVIGSPYGPVTLVYCMRRTPSVSHEEFSSSWRQHALIAENTPSIGGYRQLHADPERSATAARALGVPDTGIDGVVLASFPSVRAFGQAVGGPKTFTQPSLESEQRFNDITRATAVLTRVGDD